MTTATVVRLVRAHAGTAAIEIVVNLVAPYAAYSLAKPHVGDVDALLISMVPPVGWSVIEFLRTRRVDALSLFIVAGIALSLVAFAGGGSVRILQLRENLVTGPFGIAFLVSAAVRAPLISVLARASMRRRSLEAAESYARLQTDANVQRTTMMLTIVWGAVLVAQTALACVLVFAMPIATYLLVGPIVGYAIIGALALWTWWYVERQKRR